MLLLWDVLQYLGRPGAALTRGGLAFAHDTESATCLMALCHAEARERDHEH
jgi:hypothetical protein